MADAPQEVVEELQGILDREEQEYLDEVERLLGSEGKEFQYQRSPAERRVDFAAIERVLDEDAVRVDLALREPIRKVLDDLIELIKRQDKAGGITDSFVMGITLTTGPEAQRILGDYLLKVWKRGRELAAEELPDKIHSQIIKYHLPGQHDQCDHSPTGECVDSDADVEQDAKKTLKDQNISLSKTEARALDKYTDFGSDDINSQLRAGDKSNPIIKIIDAAILRSRLSQSIIVWRGTKILEGFKIGDEVTELGYVSTSTNYFTAANEFGGASGIQTKIFIPKGANALYLEPFIKNGQHEVLLPRGSKFRINKIEETEISLSLLQDKSFVRRFAGLEPVQAINFFQNLRPWLVKGIIDDELKKSARLELTEHLKGGRTLTETIGNLRDAWEPWVGDPTKVMPSGISGMPEDILQAHRLENIVRTEAIGALNSGRVEIADEAGDFILGFSISAILDDRTTLICQEADGVIIRKDDARIQRLTPPLHFQCRSIMVFVTSDDIPVEWSSEAELDKIVRLIQPGFK